MPITANQIQAAQVTQHAAAHDGSPTVRLVAGPGTGKSYAIEERVFWLLGQPVAPNRIAAVSFTRAASVDLRNRISAYCANQNQPAGAQVRVSTLHSLALRILRAAGLLQQYPADPLVLDKWELENVFDAEFGATEHIGKRRREQIRRDHEAFWNTGAWNPPNYIPPALPITGLERQAFLDFHGPRTQTYACVLPGEIVRQCLNNILAGNVDPVGLIHLEQLIVDEYQDLNPIDQQFVDELIARGVATFIAGDDDQSIYSFRYASPAGIQSFSQQHLGTGQHTLNDCFRCATTIVVAANDLIANYAAPNRIAKHLQSLYPQAAPPVDGSVFRWRFQVGTQEADALAASCLALINAGLNPRDILILLSDQHQLLPLLRNALTAAGVLFEPPRAESFIDSDAGRFALALIRIVCEMHDYVAHRLVLGLRAGVGTSTCNRIAEAVVTSGLNFRDLFYNALPAGVFNGLRLTALNHARHVCGEIAGWLQGDTLGQRSLDIRTLIEYSFGVVEAQSWDGYSAGLPQEMTLLELRDWLWADNDEQQMTVLASVFTRLNQPIPQVAVLPPRVRIMSMHGAKGLSARVVFVPGLEDGILPGPKRIPYPGLVLEAARLLYVSLTRSRATCVLSYATHRTTFGRFAATVPSRFNTAVAGPFAARAGGLTLGEVQQIMGDIGNL